MFPLAFPALAAQRIIIFGSARVELIYIRKVSTKQVLALALRMGFFRRALVKTEAYIMDPVVV
jgi:hypothetical protein